MAPTGIIRPGIQAFVELRRTDTSPRLLGLTGVAASSDVARALIVNIASARVLYLRRFS